MQIERGARTGFASVAFFDVPDYITAHKMTTWMLRWELPILARIFPPITDSYCREKERSEPSALKRFSISNHVDPLCNLPHRQTLDRDGEGGRGGRGRGVALVDFQIEFPPQGVLRSPPHRHRRRSAESALVLPESRSRGRRGRGAKI